MNRFLVLLAALAVFAFTAFALTRDTEQTKTVDVDLPGLKAISYFSDTNRLTHWMVPFTNGATYHNNQLTKGKDTLSILKLGAYQMDFLRHNHQGSLPFSISVIPHRDSVFKSFLTLSYTIPRWKKLVGHAAASDAEASLDSLQRFLGDPARLYGFAIKGEPVVDTSFLFAKKTIRKTDFAAETKALFDMLISEAAKRNAGYNGVRIFHFTDHGDERTIFASIGITKNVETKETDPVSLKKMPYQMNLLTLDYKGPYKDLPKAYQALEDYRADYRFVTMAIPFHKYLDEGYGFSDSAIVHMKVCYPVF